MNYWIEKNFPGFIIFTFFGAGWKLTKKKGSVPHCTFRDFFGRKIIEPKKLFCSKSWKSKKKKKVFLTNFQNYFFCLFRQDLNEEDLPEKVFYGTRCTGAPRRA